VKEWVWLGVEITKAIHEEQLSEHGGATGLRDEGALLSALARPQNLASHGEPNGASLAAAYAFGIARNHPFVDGNKRTAWVLARLFLELNDFTLEYGQADAVMKMLALAAGEISEDELAAWLRERLKRV